MAWNVKEAVGGGTHTINLVLRYLVPGTMVGIK